MSKLISFYLRARVLLIPLLAAAFVFTQPSLAAARDQFVQSDGTQFGVTEDNPWGDLKTTIRDSLCDPFGLAIYLILAFGVSLCLWLAYKGARGDSRAWKAILIILITLSIVVSPLPFFRDFVGLDLFKDSATDWTNNCSI